MTDKKPAAKAEASKDGKDKKPVDKIKDKEAEKAKEKAAEKAREKAEQEKKSQNDGDLDLLDDDEFEEFEPETHDASQKDDDDDRAFAGDNWDDDDTGGDFAEQLKQELSKGVSKMDIDEGKEAKHDGKQQQAQQQPKKHGARPLTH